jgi:hypothetical protein
LGNWSESAGANIGCVGGDGEVVVVVAVGGEEIEIHRSREGEVCGDYAEEEFGRSGISISLFRIVLRGN